MTEPNMYITLSVKMRDERYSFSGIGESSMEIEIPKVLFEHVEFGNILENLVKAAHGDFMNKKINKIKDEETK